MSKQRRTVSVAFLGLLALLVAACGPVHLDPRWATIASVADGAQIMLAFGDRLSLIDVEDGTPVELLDSDGEPRLDAEGNPRLWEVRGTQGQTRFYTAPLTLDAETLLISSYDMSLYEIDVPVARIDTPAKTFEQHIVAGPVADGDFIYQALSDTDFVALNRDDFSEAWRIDTEFGNWSEPLIVGDVLYFSSMDHHLYALDKTSGEILWQADLQGAITSTPVYNDGHLYVGSFAKKLFDVNAETGEIMDEFPAAEWIWGSPVLSDGNLYVADMSGRVYSVSTDGLNEIWQTQAATRGIAPSPLVTDERVIVASRDQNVYWLDRETGEVTDTKAVAGEVLANLLLIEPSETVDIPESLVIVSTAAPQELLVAFTLDRGQRLWAYGR